MVRVLKLLIGCNLFFILGGIVAASIRDSLELATKLGPDNKKNVRWDKLYYNDDSVAEEGFLNE